MTFSGTDFKPLPFLSHPLVQTVASAFWPELPDRGFSEYIVKLRDGDELVVLENRPQAWKPSDRIVILVHGLVNDAQTPYVLRISRRLNRLGYLTLRVNLRGAGRGFGRAKKPYHAGHSHDTHEVLKWLKERFPEAPVTQVGFSLGGNITLKMLGEYSGEDLGNLDSAIAISPPLFLADVAGKLASKNGVLFDQFFVWRLRYEIFRLKKANKELQVPKLPWKISLTELDDYFTAPVAGYESAKDYYENTACAPWISKIKVPTTILLSQDDPIVDPENVHRVSCPSNVKVVLTKKGGHVGFLGAVPNSHPKDIYWMDAFIANEIKN